VSQQAPRSTDHGELRRGIVSALLGLGAYYGCRALGIPPLEALLIATVVSALRVIYSAWRIRAFEPIAGFILAMDALTVAIGLLTQSPAIAMLGQHAPGVIIELFLIVSLARNKPATETMLNWIRPGWVDRHIADHEWSQTDAQAYHRTHLGLTSTVAIIQLVHLGIATIVIFTLPPDIAKATVGLLSLASTLINITLILGVIGQFLRRHKAPQPAVA